MSYPIVLEFDASIEHPTPVFPNPILTTPPPPSPEFEEIVTAPEEFRRIPPLCFPIRVYLYPPGGQEPVCYEILRPDADGDISIFL